VIISDDDEHVVRVRFNRPDKKNAITTAMYDAMAGVLESAERDRSVRAVVLLGGAGCFTAGNDLNDFRERPPSDEASPAFRFIKALARATVPLIAAVDGVAIGIGTTMLLHCDVVLASEQARFQMPFVNLGLVPEAGSTYLLPKMLGHARAADLVLRARPFDAATAKDLGIVTEICPAAEIEATARAIARDMAAKPPAAMRRAKALLKSDLAAVEACIDAEVAEYAERLASAELKEVIAAFLEKRAPDFSNCN
jgi:enoyl-CoA hydratase/carnithine racemase